MKAILGDLAQVAGLIVGCWLITLLFALCLAPVFLAIHLILK